MIKILLPTDYSECSLAALRYAARLARDSGGSLLLLHVILPDSPTLITAVEEEPDPLRQDTLMLLQNLAQNNTPIQFEERRVKGIPSNVIVATADEEKVDLIVMGTMGRTGLRRILMGSVAEDVVRRASCPVLTLRTPPRGTETSDALWQKWTSVEHPPVIPGPTEDDTAPRLNENPTVSLVSRAVAARASDIHIDPLGQEFGVRFRIDGQLHQYCRLSLEVGHALMTQLKVMANLNIADPFHSKEGRLELPDSLQNFEARVTCVPVLDGEAVSVRLLNRKRLMRPMEELGMTRESQDRILQILGHGEGLVLVTGPTGSGKTTTLYSMLHALDNGTRNIVTIEDPVEYSIPTFRQLPVDPRHGATMDMGLRSLLRLDPDVVLVGEIRDVEAAQTAMRAASSGKHVFSSLHTRDVASTVTALRDLQIDNRSLAGNLIGIISQRLIRRVCTNCCRTSVTNSAEAAVFREHGIEPPSELNHAVGCPHCHNTGYYDRIGLFEVVSPLEGIVKAIESGEPEDYIRAAIRAQGVSNLQTEALKHAVQGITSLNEAQSAAVR